MVNPSKINKFKSVSSNQFELVIAFDMKDALELSRTKLN